MDGQRRFGLILAQVGEDISDPSFRSDHFVSRGLGPRQFCFFKIRAQLSLRPKIHLSFSIILEFFSRDGHRVKKKGLNFLKFDENRWNRAGPNSKTAEFTVHCFKISKKDKSQQKICKKTRSNSKVTSEEIFVKPSYLDW
jgi:hypothetical protein